MVAYPDVSVNWKIAHNTGVFSPNCPEIGEKGSPEYDWKKYA